MPSPEQPCPSVEPKTHDWNVDDLLAFHPGSFDEIPQFDLDINRQYGEAIGEDRDIILQRVRPWVAKPNPTSNEVLAFALENSLPIPEDDPLHQRIDHFNRLTHILALRNHRLIFQEMNKLQVYSLPTQDKEDLFQTGFMYLVEAARVWNPKIGTFAGYAHYQILRGFTIELAYQADWGIKLNDMRLYRAYRSMEQLLTQKLGDQSPSREQIVAAVELKFQKKRISEKHPDPTLEEIDDYLNNDRQKTQKAKGKIRRKKGNQKSFTMAPSGYTKHFQERMQQMERIVAIVTHPLSLDDLTSVIHVESPGETNKVAIPVWQLSLESLQTDDDIIKIEEEIRQIGLSDRLRDAVMGLTDRELDIMYRRVGFRAGEKPQTLQQIADYYKVTVERIRQIEYKALSKLRHPVRSEELRDFL